MKISKLFALSAITTICFSLMGCDNNNSNNDGIVLNVYNCAEYIDESIFDDFTALMKEKHNEEVTISYSTYETNEDLFNQLKAGGIQYDLVCPSDYMIQKMIMNDMLEPLDSEITNYKLYGSNYIKQTFDTIETHDLSNNLRTFSEFAVPYMWGTMGFAYDPEAVEGIREDVTTWDVIWNEKYINMTSLKDSVRDTYVAATLHVYKNELELARKLLQEGYYSASQYNEKVTEIMNRCDDDTIVLVEAALKVAKDNIFELEVDTGKSNFINGKYPINFCWSGDAVYSLDIAEETGGRLLEYVVPKEGSNIWFDGWVMPKGANVKYSQELMNFLCDPKIAERNMSEVGYTSAIAGQEMWELIQDWYGEDESEDTHEYDLTYFFEGTGIKEEGVELESFIIHTSEANRQLYAQYPTIEVVQRCAIMKDFGSQNDKVNEMWIRFKGNNVSWVIFVFLGVVIAGVVFFEIKNAYNRRARKRRNIK